MANINTLVNQLIPYPPRINPSQEQREIYAEKMLQDAAEKFITAQRIVREQPGNVPLIEEAMALVMMAVWQARVDLYDC